MRLSELREKEVINIQDCARLGHVCDFIFDEKTCCIISLVVPGPVKCFGLLGHDHEYIIPCRCVCQIGADIVLVDVRAEDVLEKCKGY